MQSSDNQSHDILSLQLPITLEFNFTGLDTNTNYTLFTSATYRNYSFNEYILPIISDISPSINLITSGELSVSLPLSVYLSIYLSVCLMSVSVYLSI